MRVWELQDQFSMILEHDVSGEHRGIHADNSIVVSPSSYGMMVTINNNKFTKRRNCVVLVYFVFVVF